ncbi:MAG TPA: ABC transporter substrate-binding protein [Chloroflexota bacterium]|jgi:NitT/TauT family transport system substrate-binding protein|nr:ABC transporter substrate-binding protein [Chloroflexota bacterium]
MSRLARTLTLGSLLLGLIGCGPPASPRPAATPTAPASTPSATAPAAAQAAKPLRVGHQSIAANTVLFIAADRGYFQQEGLAIELVNFSDASQMIPALSTEQLDVAGIAANPATWNAVARGVPLKVVLDQATFRPGHGTTALLIRKEVYDSGRGHTLADLRGLTIAFTPPGRGTTNACAMAPALQRAGLTFDDFTIQNLPFPDMLPALVNGAVDGAVSAEPFMTRALQQGAAVKVMGEDEMYPNFTVAFIGFSGALYTDRATARQFVRAYLRATRAYLAALAGSGGELSREEVNEIVARHTGIDVATVRAMVPVGISPNGLPNRDSMQYCYGFFRDQGLIPQPVSDAAMQALWGTDLVEEVLGELGRRPES